jgi:hypothetical protein
LTTDKPCDQQKYGAKPFHTFSLPFDADDCFYAIVGVRRSTELRCELPRKIIVQLKAKITTGVIVFSGLD